MVYQPRIDWEHVRRLYELKEATGVPMTVIVNKILAEYFESFGASTARAIDPRTSWPIRSRARGLPLMSTTPTR